MAAQQQQLLPVGDTKRVDNGFTKYFQSMPEKSDTTIRLFDRNEYYTAHGDDALFVAKQTYGTTSSVNYYGPEGNKVASVCLNKLNFEAFARELLLVKKYRLEIYRNKNKSGNDWIISYKASPGNLQQLEDIIYTGGISGECCVVMAIKLASINGQRIIGVAFVDSSAHTLGVCQFNENDNFANIESLLVQLNPKECLVVAKDSNSESAILRRLLHKTNILMTERKKSDFSTKDIVQDLSHLLKGSVNASTIPEIDFQQSMESLTAIIKYLELLSDERNFNSYQILTYNIHQYMKLDISAACALNIESVNGDDNTMSLNGVLNKCCTSQGTRLLNQWIKQPLTDLKRIIERQNIVEIFVDHVTIRQMIQDNVLKLLPDFFRLAKKLHHGKGSLQDCYRIYQALKLIPNLIEGLSGYHGNHRSLLDEIFIIPLKELNEDFVKYDEMIETTLDLDMIQHHEYLIKPSFDEELQQLRNNMDNVEEKINAIFRKTASELGLEAGKNLKLESNSQLGYYLRLTKKMEKLIRGQHRYIVIDARNDGVRFTLSILRTLSDEYQQLQQLYNETQNKFATEVINIAGGYFEPLLSLNDIIAQLDALASLGQVATQGVLSYVRPTLTDKGTGDIVLHNARHPCVELQDDVSFIANDVSLLRGKDEFQIITGPNMGGKSTYIRMIGTIVLMAQIGSYVPCTAANISIVDTILARVGASDSQLRGVSTFMSEMLETSTILKTATKDSLIIIDELGRGTSTYDGFGLAWSISQYIANNIGCFCLFATHFHELTTLADIISTVSNRHVTALTSNDTLTLLYRVQKGVSDQSFGIQVAEMAQFPSNVIEFAKQKASELEVFHYLNNKDDGTVDEPTAKKRRTEIKEGEELIDEYLRKIGSLHIDQMSDEEIDKEMQRLRTEILSENNSYIKALIS